MHCGVHCGVVWPCVHYLLYHDTVDAHVYVTPGEVEDVDPAESKRHHQKAQVFLLPTCIQPG